MLNIWETTWSLHFNKVTSIIKHWQRSEPCHLVRNAWGKACGPNVYQAIINIYAKKCYFIYNVRIMHLYTWDVMCVALLRLWLSYLNNVIVVLSRKLLFTTCVSIPFCHISLIIWPSYLYKYLRDQGRSRCATVWSANRVMDLHLTVVYVCAYTHIIVYCMRADRWVQMYADEWWCVMVSADVCRCVVVCGVVWWWVHMCADVWWCIMVCDGECRCMMVCDGECRCVQMCDGVCRCVVVCADVQFNGVINIEWFAFMCDWSDWWVQ